MDVGRFSRAFAQRYLTIDGRSLAFCRIALAGVLVVDLLRRLPWLRDLYTNDGLLPNHTMLWRPWQPHMFSFFFVASRLDEAAVHYRVALEGASNEAERRFLAGRLEACAAGGSSASEKPA